MRIGDYDIGKQEVSIALMIFFALTAMFFLGYKFAYDKAIGYANEQIEEKISEFGVEKSFVSNPISSEREAAIQEVANKPIIFPAIIAAKEAVKEEKREGT